MNLGMDNLKLNSIEERLTATLLVSSGLPLSYVQQQFSEGRFTKYLSGDLPSTVIILGELEFPFPVNPSDSIVAEMEFELDDKYVELLLLRYDTGKSEIEINVNGNSAPWQGTRFPEKFTIYLKTP
jgi:hypothetical protein